jgi:D-3-phosphoglycerate dehydrogenase
MTHPNVICTPHIGAQTVEAQNRASVDIAEDVTAVLDAREPRCKVTSNL